MTKQSIRNVTTGSGHFVTVTKYPDPDVTQPYKYNGKELDRMHGLDLYDYGFRQYDPVVPSWHKMDPLAEKYYWISPYAYCANNPIAFIDVDGNEKIDALDPNEEKNRELKLAAHNFKDEQNVINIWAHGSQDGLTVYDSQTKENVSIRNVQGFVDFLDKNSTVWKNRTGDQNITIVLHSCETAKTNNDGISFAQRISKDINADIIAPTENVYCLGGNEYGTFKNSVKVMNENGSVQIPSKYAGRWIQYYNGVQTSTYKGNSLPGSKNYIIITKNSSFLDKAKHFLTNW